MKVLLATDHSNPAADAASLTARLPLATPMDLTILSVVSSRDVPAKVLMHPGWTRVVNSMIRGVKSETSELVAKFEQMAKSVTSDVADGHPADKILETANDSGADLIVVGAVGHSALTRMFLGSVSDSVATHAEQSVIVARPPAESDDSTFQIVIGYDGSERSAASVEEIANAFDPEKTSITLVSVVMTVGSIAVEFAEAAAAAWAEANEAARETLTAKANELADRGFEVATEVLSGDHIGDEVCRFAESNKADLLVVGDQGHGLLQRFVLGSVSRYVLRHAHNSVWISRARQQA